MVRQDLIESAVSFLQDPSVASAPVEKKIAFLQSKNLTQEEIDLSLATAGEGASGATTATAPSPAPSAYQYGRAPPPPPYGSYPGYWQQQPPPEVPKRDWRDWFIMATVLGGVGYGLYFTAKRYVIPLIAPPTPPQLEQDKSEIDKSFEKAFALLDQLNSDTNVLKEAEENRTKRLDATLAELETVLTSLKEADRKREDDARRNADDIRSLRDLIPQALEAQKKSSDERLKDLGAELKGLKTLVGNRMSGASVPSTMGNKPTSSSGISSMYGNAIPGINGASSGAPPSTLPSSTTNAVPATTGAATTAAEGTATTATLSTTERPVTPFSSRWGSGGGKAAIPAWQRAAAKKSEESLNGEKKTDTSESGTVTEASAS